MNTLNLKVHALSPWSNGRFDTWAKPVGRLVPEIWAFSQKLFFGKKKSKFWLRGQFFWLKWPLYGSRTPETDYSTSHWCTLSGFWPKIAQKIEEKTGEREERGVSAAFLVVDWGGSSEQSLIYLENGKSYMTSEGGIFLVFQWGCGKICEIRQNRPRNVQKSDILAIFGLSGPFRRP